MIIVSYNFVIDNGVKIVDFMGDMFEQEWERYVIVFVNVLSDKDLVKIYNVLVIDFKIDFEVFVKVIYGCDI